MIKAERCPFCGQIPDVDDPATFRHEVGSRWASVVCCIVGPEIRAGFYTPLEEWRDEAIAAWNQRAAPDDVPQRATYFKLAAQDNLEAQYKVLQDRGYSGFEIAQHLARYAEAGTYNRLTAEIEKLREEISKLRAKPDAQGEWQPLPDGWHDAQDAFAIYVRGDTVTFHDSDTGYERDWVFEKGERLCRKRIVPVEVQPDWTKLPQSIMWWCVNADGRVAVSDDAEPIAQGGWDTWTFAHGILDGGGLPVRVIIPIGTDWRLLKQQRPVAEAGATESKEE